MKDNKIWRLENMESTHNDSEIDESKTDDDDTDNEETDAVGITKETKNNQT